VQLNTNLFITNPLTAKDYGNILKNNVPDLKIRFSRFYHGCAYSVGIG